MKKKDIEKIIYTKEELEELEKEKDYRSWRNWYIVFGSIGGTAIILGIVVLILILLKELQ